MYTFHRRQYCTCDNASFMPVECEVKAVTLFCSRMMLRSNGSCYARCKNTEVEHANFKVNSIPYLLIGVDTVDCIKCCLSADQQATAFKSYFEKSLFFIFLERNFVVNQFMKRILLKKISGYFAVDG